jgi:L-aminopeptidase/D-esterase-like protein
MFGQKPMAEGQLGVNRRDLLARAAVASTVSPLVAAAPAATASLPVGAPAARPGLRNLITDVPGLRVGNAEDTAVRTGATVVVPDKAAVVAAEVGGGGPATRETDATQPQNLVHAFDAVVLSGGSVYGLATADGVVAWLGARHRGYGLSADPATPLSPVVPAAALYDLANGGRKDWGVQPPYWALGAKAMDALGDDFPLGTAGAGYGAMAGGLKGGLGSASIIAADGITVGALVAVNSAGSVVGADGRTFWAAPFEIGGEFGGLGPAGLRGVPDDWGRPNRNPSARKNTTLAVVATDVTLTSDEAKRVAIMAHDGMARAIRPSHSPFDGDIVFAISTGQREAAEPRAFAVSRIGALAADTLARAIARAVFLATPWPGTAVRTWKTM